MKKYIGKFTFEIAGKMITVFRRRQWAAYFFMLFSAALFSQSIGIGTEMPHASATLDITSTSRGFLIPRMTSTQRNAINMPAVGLLVFDNTTSCFWYRNAQEWTILKSRWHQNGNNIFNANSGNVGIGVSNPLAKLDVLGVIRSLQPGNTPDGSSVSLSAIGGDPGIKLARGDGSGSEARRWDIKVDNDHSLRIRDNNAALLRLMIDSTGDVGIGTSAPHPAAVLDVNSNSKGFLMPRMTLLQRMEVSSPAEGLIIWCNDCGLYGEAQIYTNGYWANMIGDTASGVGIGDFYHGGIVAYVFQPGDPGYVAGEIHGLIAAENDLSSGVWGCSGTDLPGCQGTALGTGNQNTNEIVAGCGTQGIAARKCFDLVLNGYNDWFLPSRDEWSKMYTNIGEIGGFMEEKYWCSSEITATIANTFVLAIGFWGSNVKTDTHGVRAMRYF